MDKIDQVNQSPIGLKPRFLGIEDRLDEIYAAKKRYIEVKKDVPIQWIIEELELLLWLSINVPTSYHLINIRQIV